MTTYSYTTLQDPSQSATGSTFPQSINSTGQVTGYYYNGTTYEGFIVNSPYSNGAYTTLQDPSQSTSGFTVPLSINSTGQVTGYYYNGTTYEGFIVNSPYSNGAYTTLKDPSQSATGYTFPSSINYAGQVTGYYYNGTTEEGFLVNSPYGNGNYTTLSGPQGANWTNIDPTSINDSAQVTGSYYNGTSTEGFVYSHGTYTTLLGPQNSNGTNPTSINSIGQVTGNYNNGTTTEGFLATPVLYTSGVMAQSPITLNNFDWANGWNNDANNPRLLSDVDENGTADYLAFGDNYTFVADGGTWTNGQGGVGPGFANTTAVIHDFGSNEGYTAAAQRGAAVTGYGLAESIYGQGFQGIYWYGATSELPLSGTMDAAGKTYYTPIYDTSPHLYGQFGTQEGWSVHNGFDIVKASNTDTYASILGFGDAGIVVGPQAFAPGANGLQSYVIPFGAGNNSGWDQTVDVRTFQDSNGGAIDLNHDGITDFVGMGPQGLEFAYGSVDASGHYSLGTLQTANLGGGPNLGEAQGWTDSNSLREVVHDSVTGFDDIIAFGAAGVYVAMGQDPSTHNGQPFGPMYLAMADMGTNQGWSNTLTPRLVGDVTGGGNPDLVGFGANNTFIALGSRDASNNLYFSMSQALTIHDFGYNEGWSTQNTVRQLADVTGNGNDSLVLSGAHGTHVVSLT